MDSSVLVDHLNDTTTPAVDIFRGAIAARRIRVVVGDLVLAEVLQGLRNEREAARVEAALRRFTIMPMVGAEVAIKAAAHYRALRRLGITVRRTIDMLIATFCIARSLPLLHSNRDFDHLERHCGLQVVR